MFVCSIWAWDSLAFLHRSTYSKSLLHTTSKMDCHLLRQRVRQRISVIPENWHFNSRLVLKTTKTPVFVFITEILWQTFWRNKWRSVFDVVKNLRLCTWLLDDDTTKWKLLLENLVYLLKRKLKVHEAAPLRACSLKNDLPNFSNKIFSLQSPIMTFLACILESLTFEIDR